MTNIINLMDHNEEQRLINELQIKMNEMQKSIDSKTDEMDQLRIKNNDLAGNEAVAKGIDLKNIKAERKSLQATIKNLKISIDNDQKLLDGYNGEFSKIKQQYKREFVKQNSEENAKKVFEENNIHYVIFDQQWWSVDPRAGRMDLKINNSETNVIKDLIFDDSGWEIQTEQELKRIAKELGRFYKHIVRDFEGKRQGVYNQMDTIRNQWLQPIYDVTPHESFRLLTLSIAGGDNDYADQLEKWVAYRYEHPNDVMIPNIDSCAVGGTGRDTFYNIIRTIFTDECCGSVGTETFKGTHNGDLFGKMFIKIDEKDSYSVPIDKIKEFTGNNRYRHRAMNRDARDVARLFAFLMFRNGFTTTARLSGTGSSGEDRRWEPVIARVNLVRHLAFHYGLIKDINEIPDNATITAMMIFIKDWQRDYFKNETRIAEWLGYIINKHNAKQMTELMPLHGIYYTEMLERQKKGIDGFMPRFMDLLTNGTSTVININDAHKLYQVAESTKCTKDWFKNAIMYWLNTQLGWDCEEAMDNVFTWDGCTNNDRRKMIFIRNKSNIPNRLQFDINDFIDRDATDDKGTTVGEKINVFSIREELR